jgi:predicted O-methyltransferase YrrM
VGDELSRLLAHRRALLERGYSRGRSGRAIPISESLPQSHGEIIGAIAARVKARHVLEVGLGSGLSTLFLCEDIVRRGAWTPGDVVSIDPFQHDIDDAGRVNLRDGGVEVLVEVRETPSQLALPDLCRSGRRFDLAFIDGDHLFDGTFVDLYFVDQLLLDNSVVIVDDVYLPAVSWALGFFIHNRAWTLLETSPLDGAGGADWDSWRLAVLRVPGNRRDRPWDHFVPFGAGDG